MTIFDSIEALLKNALMLENCSHKHDRQRHTDRGC